MRESDCLKTKMEEGCVQKISTIKPRISSEIPAPRSGHRCVADEKNLFVFGGYSPHSQSQLFRELWRFNFARSTWKLLQTTGPFPEEVCSSCVLLDHGHLIIYGGSGVPFGDSNSNKLHVLNLNENRWSVVDGIAKREKIDDDGDDEDDDNEILNLILGRAPRLPIAGYGQCMVLSPDRELYIFAGTSGREFNSFLTRFNFASKEWDYIPREDPPFILPRYRHEAVTYGDSFYVFGGGMGGVDPTDFCNLREVPTFCFLSQKWDIVRCHPSQTHGFPPRRRCHGCVLFEDKVYICGGYDGIHMYDDIWSLDLTSFQWTKLSMVLPYPVYFHSTAITPSGCMLTFGGVKSIDAETDIRSNDLHRLWLVPPSLVELSAQAVMSCIPNIESVSQMELAQLGIPFYLLQ